MNRPDKESPVEDWVRHVKRSLRGMMNGPVSASMRSKGQTYKVNFGVELPRLREMAEELPHTFSLAIALWRFLLAAFLRFLRRLASSISLRVL